MTRTARRPVGGGRRRDDGRVRWAAAERTAAPSVAAPSSGLQRHLRAVRGDRAARVSLLTQDQYVCWELCVLPPLTTGGGVVRENPVPCVAFFLLLLLFVYGHYILFRFHM